MFAYAFASRAPEIELAARVGLRRTTFAALSWKYRWRTHVRILRAAWERVLSKGSAAAAARDSDLFFVLDAHGALFDEARAAYLAGVTRGAAPAAP